MKKSLLTSTLLRASSAILCVSLSAHSVLAAPLPILGAPAAATPAAEATTFDVSADDVIKANLDKMVGQSITLRLDSGEEMGGVVSKVGDTAVHLSSLTGKEFFDAIIPLDRVNAIVVRVKK